MKLRVLGALSAHENAQALDLGGRQQRLVLALLAARANNVVSLDRLLDDMWGEEVPASARKAVQGYVSNLRKLLGAESIRTEPTGYRLIADPAQLDALAFEEALGAARADPDPTSRSAGIADALAMWTGRPYEDLEDAEALTAEIERLDELRLAATEDLIDIEIGQGRSAEVLPEVGRLVSAHPFRESTRGLQMRALYSAGRQREALQAYEDIRQALATEIGVEPGAALKELEAQILTQDDSLNAGSGTTTGLKPPNPFRGLRPFDERSGSEFFGRDTLVRRLLEHIDRPTTSRLTLVAGASGAGKSSVVRAGLVPALERDERSTTTAIVSVGGTWADTLLTCTDDVLVLDQLESALTTPADAATALAAIADRAQRPDGPWIVATVRADYLDVLLADPAIGLLVEPALVLVPPMSDRELTDAIVEPAARVGVRVADGLTQLLVSDMRERAAGLPLLQYALTETYEANNSGELSIDDYRSVGGLGGALARRAEALIEPMPQDRRDLVRTSLIRLVTLDADGQPGLQRHTVADLTADQREVLELFGSHRMVTFDGGDTPSVSISHEALMREWPRFARWIDDARDDLVALRRLAVAANEWDAEGRPTSLLFGPAHTNRYDEALESQAASSDVVFLTASRESASRGQRRRRRNRRAIAAALGAAALIAIGFAVVASNDRQDANKQRELADEQRQVADTQRKLAEQRALVSEALVQSQNDPELGLLLAAEAYSADPSLQSLQPVLAGLALFLAEPEVLDDFAGRSALVGGGLGYESEFHDGFGAASRCTVELEPGVFLVARRGDDFALIDVVESSVTSNKSSTDACQISVDATRTRGLGRSAVTGGTALFNLENGDVEARSPNLNDAHYVADGRILGFANPLAEPRLVGDQSQSVGLLWAGPSLAEFTPTGVTATAIYPNRSGSLIVVSDEVTQPDGQRAFGLVHRYVVDGQDLSIVHDLGVVERTRNEVTWSIDGTLFGDISKSDRLRVWDARSGKLVTDGSVGVIAESGAWINFSPTNQRVALLTNDEVSIRPLDDPARTAVLVRRWSQSTQLEAAADASFIDRETIAVVLVDGTVEVTNLRSSVLAAETISRKEAAPAPLAAGWAVDGHSYRITPQTEVIDIVNPERASAPLFSAMTPARLAGIANTSQPTRVHVWAADLGSPADPGSLYTVEVDLSTLEPVGEPVAIQLLPGTRLVAGLRDRVAAQNAAGTIFQYDYEGQRLAARVDLPFVGSGIAQSPSSSRALITGSEQLALIDLDTGDTIDQVVESVGAPLLMLSDYLAVIARPGGDIELWSIDDLESIGPIVPLDKRGRGESLTVTNNGELWYHTSTESQQIELDPATMAQTACRLAGRSLTEDEWRRHVSADDPFEPAC